MRRGSGATGGRLPRAPGDSAPEAQILGSHNVVANERLVFAALTEFAQTLVGRGLIAGVEVGDIPVADARAAREMLLLGSSVKVAPVVEWDGARVGDGRPGPVSRALLALLEEDMRSSDRLIDVPY